MTKLGDLISSLATPVARALQMGCIDPATGQLRPESGCAQRRNYLNDISDAFYDRFWKQPTNNGEHMPNEQQKDEVEWMLQVVVSAPSIVEAIKNMTSGQVLSVVPRPRQVSPPVATIGGGPTSLGPVAR
jgi:hypothetical protein